MTVGSFKLNIKNKEEKLKNLGKITTVFFFFLKLKTKLENRDKEEEEE